jgi:hypothetical protein
MPFAQVPSPLPYTSATVWLSQKSAGGESHTTPAHGSVTHDPSLHPDGHVVVELG